MFVDGLRNKKSITSKKLSFEEKFQTALQRLARTLFLNILYKNPKDNYNKERETERSKRKSCGIIYSNYRN